ncbi:MAG: hypothetical protein EA378_05410 [Phycisphaerales bacterium]|nr:MAG: hypothetical protein EA378_05410 [Phycisphaerales bacterium]
MARAREGFTVYELVVSLALLVIVMLAATGLSAAATRATPVEGDRLTAVAEVNDAIDRMCAELQVAIGFRRARADLVVFAVASDTSGSSARLVQYAWSGVAGDPLVRTTHDGSSRYVEGVRSWRFEYMPFGTDLGQIARVSVEYEIDAMPGVTFRRGVGITSRPEFGS